MPRILGQVFSRSKMEAAFAVVMLAMLVPVYIQNKQMPDAKDPMCRQVKHKQFFKQVSAWHKKQEVSQDQDEIEKACYRLRAMIWQTSRDFRLIREMGGHVHQVGCMAFPLSGLPGMLEATRQSNP